MFDLIYPIEPSPVIRGGNSLIASEMLPIIDANGNVTAQASRAYCHSGSKELHPVVHLHIINRTGKLYLQQRSASKDLLPLMWDTAVGGHISYGEYVLEALFRESGEELRFFDFNPVWIDAYEFESEIEKELVNVFATVGDFKLNPDRDEVIDGRYWTDKEIGANFGKGIFTPNFEQEYQRIKDKLLALL